MSAVGHADRLAVFDDRIWPRWQSAGKGDLVAPPGIRPSVAAKDGLLPLQLDFDRANQRSAFATATIIAGGRADTISMIPRF